MFQGEREVYKEPKNEEIGRRVGKIEVNIEVQNYER